MVSSAVNQRTCEIKTYAALLFLALLRLAGRLADCHGCSLRHGD
jgi:hypothetical protein